MLLLILCAVVGFAEIVRFEYDIGDGKYKPPCLR